jgi:carboxymethylenebutenolidase
MSHKVELNTMHGVIDAWRADPAIPPKGAIVVVQEIFGVNSHIRSVVDHMAAHGYIAIAPAIFDLVQHGVELDYSDDGIGRGRELTAQVGFDKAVDCVRAAFEEVESQALVGVMGFCWGGTVAFLSGSRLGLPAVDYYGGRSVPFLRDERPSAPLLIHFGANDALIPPQDVQAHRDALPEAEIHVWPSGHGFNCDQRTDYNADAAKQAMQRTLDFFQLHLHE